MNTFLRLTSLAATVAALALTATPAQAAGQVTATPQPVAKVKILKALTLTKNADLDFGTVVTGAGVWAGEVVEIVSDGNVTCGGGVNLVCDDTSATTAKFNVSGSNNAVVNINVPPSITISSGANNLTVTTVGAPTSLTLTNSGAPGDDFSFGGQITLDSTTPDGYYEGDFDVTAEYP